MVQNISWQIKWALRKAILKKVALLVTYEKPMRKWVKTGEIDEKQPH